MTHLPVACFFQCVAALAPARNAGSRRLQRDDGETASTAYARDVEIVHRADLRGSALLPVWCQNWNEPNSRGIVRAAAERTGSTVTPLGAARPGLLSDIVPVQPPGCDWRASLALYCTALAL
jgi:hypothetical protein